MYVKATKPRTWKGTFTKAIGATSGAALGFIYSGLPGAITGAGFGASAADRFSYPAGPVNEGRMIGSAPGRKFGSVLVKPVIKRVSQYKTLNKNNPKRWPTRAVTKSKFRGIIKRRATRPNLPLRRSGKWSTGSWTRR